MLESTRSERYNADQQLALETYRKIRRMNATLADPDSSGETTPYVELCASYIAELDAMYPYVDLRVYAMGEGVYPLIDSEDDYVDEEWGKIEGLEGIHRGFNLIQRDQEDPHSFVIMHQILLREAHKYQSITAVNSMSYYFYLDPEKSSIILADDLNETFYGNRAEEVPVSTYSFYNPSARVNKLVRSYAFKRKEHQEQVKALQEMVDEAENEIGVRGSQVLVETIYGFMPVMGEESVLLKTVDLRDFPIGGVCLALDSIETFNLRRRPIHSDEDLIDKDSGLCIVIDPDEDTRRVLQLNEDQVLYLPTEQITDFKQTGTVKPY